MAAAFIAAGEDIERAVAGLEADALWARPGGIAAVGFHLAHLAGSTDRLLTYARGEALSQAQRDQLARERAVMETRPALEDLVADLKTSLSRALAELAAVDPASLLEPRAVGRMPAASTVIGLLFHTAEHAARHAGQVVTTAKLVRAGCR